MNITTCVSTYNNLPYLKLAIKSVREYSYYKDMPIIIHAENCDDGTDEWLEENHQKYNFRFYIEKQEDPVGIGGGMNYCADRVETEFINFIHSDFYVSKNWDLELHRVFEKYPDQELWVNSFRIEPNMFGAPERHGTLFVDPRQFGAYYHDFDEKSFIEYAEEFSNMNDIEIPKGEGVSGLVRKTLWDKIGGNDLTFRPTSWDDMDLFLRMRNEGVKFVMPTKSVLWHFGARGSHRLEENGGKSSKRVLESEQRGAVKFYQKWGGMPDYDQYGMICGIKR